MHSVKTRRSGWKLLALCVALLLVGWLLRVYRLGNQELRGDEAFSWNYVTHEAGAAQIVARIIREGDPQPPIHYWILQSWVRTFGDDEWAMRLPSAYLSLLLIPLTYQFGARAWNRRVGVLVAGITTLHPYQVWIAQDVRNMYQLAVAAVLVATLLLPGVLRGRRWHWIGYVLAATSAMYSHYYALFGLIAHGAFVGGTKQDHAGRRWLAAGAATALLVLPWAVVIIPVYLGGQLADPARMPVFEFLRRTLADMVAGPAVEDNAVLGFALLWIGIAGYGAWMARRLDRRRMPWIGLQVVWLLVALVGIDAIIQARATFNTFYFLVAFPAAYTLLATGLWLLWRRSHTRWATGVIGVTLLTLFTQALSNYYFDLRYSKDRGLRSVAATLSAYAQNGDAYVANFPDPAQVYYLRQINMPYFLVPPTAHESASDVSEAIAALGAAHSRLWFVPINATQWDPHGYAEAALESSFVRPYAFDFGKLSLRAYAPHAEFAAGFTPLRVTGADGIALEGALIAADGQPAGPTIPPGARLRVSLVWIARAQPSADYTVFVHVLDDAGALLAQHDGPPQAGARPTSLWRPGQSVVDVHEFVLPADSAAGAITLVAGMYLPATGARLSFQDGSDGVRLGRYSVASESLPHGTR